MGKIEPGKYVELVYELSTVDPSSGKRDLVHSVGEDDPERLVFGVTPGVIPALEKALEGLAEGDSFAVDVPASEGFPYNPDDVVELSKDIFKRDGKFDNKTVFPGAYIPMLTGDGYQITGKVLEVGHDSVKMDFNHPLVGKDLHFEGKVATVRDATPEDLHPSCGGGCGGCGDGSCGGGSCGDDGCCGGCK